MNMALLGRWRRQAEKAVIRTREHTNAEGCSPTKPKYKKKKKKKKKEMTAWHS